MKLIKSIVYNWGSPHLTIEYPETFCMAEIGKEGVIKIIEHEAAGEGDKWYYDIFHQDGTVRRIFNPNEVVYTII